MSDETRDAADPADPAAEPAAEDTAQASAPQASAAQPQTDWQALLDHLSADQLADLVARAEERDQFLDRMQRMQAETDNLRKRMQREQADRLRQANADLLRELLPALDNLVAAIQAAEEAGADDGSPLASFIEGVGLVKRQVDSVLAAHGVQAIDPAGEPFDPAHHEALMTVDSPEHPDQHVVHVLKLGFRLHDRVLRPAQVSVNKRAN